MRSKWLDWTPEAGSVGFEGSSSVEYLITQAPVPSPGELMQKSVQGEPTKPTEPISLGDGEQLLERPSYFWGADRNGKSRDYFGWRANVAIDAICGIDAPAGLILWLGEHSPFLYRRLTCDLPNRISRAWNDHVPIEDFDRLCFDLVETYRHAVELMLPLR